MRYIKHCKLCKEYKVSQQGQQGLIGRRNVERLWAVVACDLMEPSKAQNKYLTVFQDLFNRQVELKPMRKLDGKSLVKAIEKLILFRWETPDFFLCDNGKEFDNKVVKEMLEAHGIKHAPIPPHSAQTNRAERVSRSPKVLISMFVQADHLDWDVHLHEFRHAINTAVQSTTKVAPAFLNFGRHLRPVKSLRCEIEGSKLVDKIDPEVCLDRIKRLDLLRNMVAKNIERARTRGRQAREAV